MLGFLFPLTFYDFVHQRSWALPHKADITKNEKILKEQGRHFNFVFKRYCENYFTISKPSQSAQFKNGSVVSPFREVNCLGQQ